MQRAFRFLGFVDWTPSVQRLASNAQRLTPTVIVSVQRLPIDELTYDCLAAQCLQPLCAMSCGVVTLASPPHHFANPQQDDVLFVTMLGLCKMRGCDGWRRWRRLVQTHVDALDAVGVVSQTMMWVFACC
jgi:hypothetical protein